MMRALIIAALLANASVSIAQAQTAGGPPIAYGKLEGGGTSVYLTTATGSGTVKLYAAPKKHTIGSLDMKPGGNEIAVIEYNGTFPTKLKIITYNDNGAVTGTPRLLSGVCNAQTVDYHPTQPLLIIGVFCNGFNSIATVGTDGLGYQVLHQGDTNTSYRVPRWLAGGGSYVYVRASAQVPNGAICRDSCATPLWSSGASSIDVARTSNNILITSFNGFISELDGDTGQMIQPNFITGTDGHYAANDTQILFESPHDARGDYLHVRSQNGLTPRITGKGEYLGKDWRE